MDVADSAIAQVLYQVKQALVRRSQFQALQVVEQLSFVTERSTDTSSVSPKPHWQRSYINNPTQIAECGGPCIQGAQHCDCGALWRDVYIANPLPYPTIDP